MSRAVGGYVRRCERMQARITDPTRTGPFGVRYSVLPSGMVMGWRPEPPAFQSMPITSFVPFDVTEPLDSRA